MLEARGVAKQSERLLPILSCLIHTQMGSASLAFRMPNHATRVGIFSDNASDHEIERLLESIADAIAGAAAMELSC